MTELYVEFCYFKTVWKFQVIKDLKGHCIFGVNYMRYKPGHIEKSLVVNWGDNNTRRVQLSSHLC